MTQEIARTAEAARRRRGCRAWLAAQLGRDTRRSGARGPRDRRGRGRIAGPLRIRRRKPKTVAPSTPDKGDAVLVAGHPHTVEGFTRQDGTNGLSNEIIADHLGASVLLRDRRHHQGREGQHQRIRDAGGRRDTHAPPPRSAIPRYRRKGSGEAMVTKTVQTWQLRAGWIVIPQTGSPPAGTQRPPRRSTPGRPRRVRRHPQPDHLPSRPNPHHPRHPMRNKANK